MNCTGKLTTSEGDVYEGNFKMGVFSGYGKMTYANGTVYEGKWDNNKPLKNTEPLEESKEPQKIEQI